MSSPHDSQLGAAPASEHPDLESGSRSEVEAPGKGKEPDTRAERQPVASRLLEPESADDDLERRVRMAEGQVAATQNVLAHAEHKLALKEREVRQYREEYEATGRDWNEEEKGNLRTAKSTLAAGLAGTVATVASAAASLYAATEGLDAARERVQADPSAVNKELHSGARGTLIQNGFALAGAVIASIGLIYSGSLMYYNTCKKHDERVNKAASPDIVKKKERLEAAVRDLRQRLDDEQAMLDQLRESLRGRSNVVLRL